MARSLLPLVVLSSIAAGCNSGVDVTASRGDLSLHFSDAGCAIHFSGYASASGAPSAPSAVDLTCPVNLRSVKGAPVLHLSTPLVTPVGELPLIDERFEQPGYQLGHFVVVSYRDRDRDVTCDPLQAKGSITYLAIPRYGAEGRLTGRFSEDAALINCHVVGASDGNVPLRLSGVFDLATPVR